MKTIRTIGGMLAVACFIGCEASTPLEPAEGVGATPAVIATYESDPTPAIDESTITSTWSGSVETVEFSDVQGNDYRFKASYDTYGNFVSVQVYYNDNYVGRAVPTSYGSISYDTDNQWVKTDQAYTPTTFRNDNPYGDDCPEGARDCDAANPLTVGGGDEVAWGQGIRSVAALQARVDPSSPFYVGVYGAYDCDISALLLRWIWNTTGVVSLLGGATGATVVSIVQVGNLAMWGVTSAAWWSLADHSRTWWRSFRELDNCRRTRAGLPPRS